MATAVLANGVKNTVADTPQTIYTSPAAGAGTIITAFTATNNTTANRTFKAYIYASGETSAPAILPLKVLIRNKFDPGSAIVNHVIPAGGSLRVESDLADSISFYVTGNEL